MDINKQVLLDDVKRLLGDIASKAPEPMPASEPTASAPAEVVVKEMPKQVPWRLTVERDPVTGQMVGATFVPLNGGPAA